MKLEEFAKSVDYKLLLKQIQSLLEIVDPCESNFSDPDRITNLEGLLNFLDGFQDAVVESEILSEEEVFPVNNN